MKFLVGKILAFGMVLIIMLSLSACGDNSTPSNANTPTPSQSAPNGNDYTPTPSQSMPDGNDNNTLSPTTDIPTSGNDTTNDVSYRIQYFENYDNEKDLSIYIMQVDSAVVIDFDENVSDFVINNIEFEDGDFKDKGIAYDTVTSFRKGDKVVIRHIIQGMPNIRISFKTAAGVQITITPTAKGDDEVDFPTS